MFKSCLRPHLLRARPLPASQVHRTAQIQFQPRPFLIQILPFAMSSKRGSRKRATDGYISDEFVVDDDEAPKSKKAKTTKAKKSAGADGLMTDDNGDPYWEISNSRRVTVSEFKGKSMVNIREYYEKDGKTLPGKKGISLTVDQYRALLEALPAVESVLVGKGENVNRPNYDGSAAAKNGDEDVDDDDDGIDPKKNFEATSDENEE
ncbi:putative RNA polymerase II transcriptional coactivator [Phyllosticta citribraziliensis]|uniref:RNA polymerase II transcriptional coactivator n=1 Tax=Phyllosticta citribraziliensis TaxID=989973 RepID=A0ABR1LFP4_9PEZI